MTRTRSIFRPWMFVVLGVAMTVGSAVLNNLTLAEKTATLTQLSHQIELLDQKIEQQWQQTKSLEYEEHTGTIVLLFCALTKEGPATKEPTPASESVQLALQRYVDKILLSGQVPKEKAETIRGMLQQNGSATEALKQVFEEVDKSRVETVASINILYTEKTTLEQQQARVQEDMNKLSVLALFLQVMGLILVLAKDLVQPPAKESHVSTVL